MSKSGSGLAVPLHRLVLLAGFILAPTLAHAGTFVLGGGGDCSDPPGIFSQVFSFSADTAGGSCAAFGNHSGTSFNSLAITTALPDDLSNLYCSGGNFFEFCSFTVDVPNDLLTIKLFGTNDSHPGIASIPTCSLDIECGPTDNFSINLNDLVCDPAGRCTQSTSDTGSGGWLTGGSPDAFTAAANGAAVPEPASAVFLIVGLGAVLARRRLAKHPPV
jgi:hypothetical protein